LLVEHRRELVNNQTRLLNWLRSPLKGYFPQVLAWFQPLDTQVASEFLKRWPALQAVQQVDDAALLRFFPLITPSDGPSIRSAWQRSVRRRRPRPIEP
jgi:hypothetical protein